MTSRAHDPLIGTDRLLIDGTNLLYAMRGRPAEIPPAALVGRLRAAIPPAVGIELVLDGPPDPGMRGARVAAGTIVRHAGRRSADELLLSLVDDARRVAGPASTAGILVVTDDRALRDALRVRGARTTGASWLIGRLDRPRLASPSVGNRRPPRTIGGASPGGAPPPGTRPAGRDDDGPGWRPGRGATNKRGNPRRGRPPSGRMPA